MDRLKVRQANANDASQIAALHCVSWRDAYSDVLDPAFLAGPIEGDRLSLWTNRLEKPDPRRIILVGDLVNSIPAAFGCAFVDLDEAWGSWIDNLHVHPNFRGEGIGEVLIRTLARFLATKATSAGVYLWVFEANEAALRFYQRLGGEVVERDNSQIPAANGAHILRVFWPNISMLTVDPNDG